MGCCCHNLAVAIICHGVSATIGIWYGHRQAKLDSGNMTELEKLSHQKQEFFCCTKIRIPTFDAAIRAELPVGTGMGNGSPLDDIDTCCENVVQNKYSNVLLLHQDTTYHVPDYLFLPPTSPHPLIKSVRRHNPVVASPDGH